MRSNPKGLHPTICGPEKRPPRPGTPRRGNRPGRRRWGLLGPHRAASRVPWTPHSGSPRSEYRRREAVPTDRKRSLGKVTGVNGKQYTPKPKQLKPVTDIVRLNKTLFNMTMLMATAAALIDDIGEDAVRADTGALGLMQVLTDEVRDTFKPFASARRRRAAA